MEWDWSTVLKESLAPSKMKQKLNFCHSKTVTLLGWYRLLSIRAPPQLAVNRPDNRADRQVATTPGNRFTSPFVTDPPLHQLPLVQRSALASAVECNQEYICTSCMSRARRI